MDSMCSRGSVLGDMEAAGEGPFSELSLRNSPSQSGANNSPQKRLCTNENGSFTSSNENNSFPDINEVSSYQGTSDLPQETKSAEEGSTTMEKISMLLGAHFPEDSKLLSNPKGIIKSYLSIAAANDPDKFDSYRKLCMAHVNEYYRHLKGDAGALCLVCNMPCQHWNTLQRHLQTHINFRPFSCELCGRTFYSQSKLKRHQVIHNDIKPYKCPVCERRLGRPEHLKRHLLVHTDSKPFGCSGCSHTTKRLDGIRRHIKRKHGADGAKIVEIDIPFDSQMLNNVQLTNNSIEEPMPPPIKAKKKKKKKKNNSAVSITTVATNNACQQQNAQESHNSLATVESVAIKSISDETETPQQNQMPKDIVNGTALDVAAGFGVRDLRVFSNNSDSSFAPDAEQIKGQKQRFQSCSQKLSHSTNDKPACNFLVSSHPMHLLYQKLARSTPTSEDHNSQNNANSLRVPNNNQGFTTEQSNIPQNEVFSSNGSVNQMVTDQQRYLSSSGNGVNTDNSSRHINPMLLTSPVNTALSHYPHPPDLSSLPAEMMISQYFQSHQRFAPPVWGFANPNYPNY